MATITKACLPRADPDRSGIGPCVDSHADLRQAIEIHLTNELGRSIRVGRLYFALIPRPQLVVEDVADEKRTLRSARCAQCRRSEACSQSASYCANCG